MRFTKTAGRSSNNRLERRSISALLGSTLHACFYNYFFDNTKVTTMKKYELIECQYPNMYRIRALRDFGSVKKGDIGGCIESEANLSQAGDCWVDFHAIVFDGAKVLDDARICEHAIISRKAVISQKAVIKGKARVDGRAQVYGFAVVSDQSVITDNVQVFGNAKVLNESYMSDNAQAFGDAEINNVGLRDNAKVYGNSILKGQNYRFGMIWDDAQVYGNAKLLGRFGVGGFSIVCDDALIHGLHEFGNPGHVVIRGNVVVKGNSRLVGRAIDYYGDFVIENETVEKGFFS